MTLEGRQKYFWKNSGSVKRRFVLPTSSRLTTTPEPEQCWTGPRAKFNLGGFRADVFGLRLQSDPHVQKKDRLHHT